MSSKAIAMRLSWVAGAMLVGCGQNTPPAGSPQTQSAAAVASQNDKGGAQLWAENCSRCHNIRPPESFSDAQWQTVVHHMRLRADLTGEEARSILDFLKSSN